LGKRYFKSLTINAKNNNAIEKLLEAKNNRKKFKKKSFKQLAGLIDQSVNEVLSNKNLNSVSIAVYRDGKIYHNYYGELETNSRNKPNDSTLFEIASISKVFLGSLLAEAVLEDKIKLDDDIRKYLKNDYPNLEYEGKPITIKNLLTHTIGFDTPPKLRLTYDKISKGYYDTKQIDYNMNSLLEELKTVELKNKPGLVYSYNNVGSELGAYILEQVNGYPYKEQLQSFLSKLDMNNTYLQDFEKHRKYIATGYDETNNLAPIDKNPLLGGSAGMISTIPDLTKFMKFQLESTNPLVKESTTTLFKNDEGNHMGYLWQDMGIAKEEGFYYSKTGDANGIKSGMLICPDSKYGQIVIVNNQTEAANNDWGTIFNKIETELIKYPKINLYALTKEEFIKNKNFGLEKFNALKTKKDLYYNTDLIWTLNMIGYELLNKKQIEKAIEMFEFAIEQSPENANLYDSLGEAYFIGKDYKKALISYKKSVELNPSNDNAKAYIEKINKILKG
jgi:CubicO group peptidase (beta-lactamase class C family)